MLEKSITGPAPEGTDNVFHFHYNVFLPFYALLGDSVPWDLTSFVWTFLTTKTSVCSIFQTPWKGSLFLSPWEFILGSQHPSLERQDMNYNEVVHGTIKTM